MMSRGVVDLCHAGHCEHGGFVALDAVEIGVGGVETDLELGGHGTCAVEGAYVGAHGLVHVAQALLL